MQRRPLGRSHPPIEYGRIDNFARPVLRFTPGTVGLGENSMIRTRQPRVALLVGFFVVAVAASLASSQAHATVPAPTAFELLFSPSARVLGAYDTPQYYDVKYDESCDNPNLRIRARNKPAVLIENSDTSAAPITAFTLQINQGPYLFGMGDAASDNFNNFIKETIYSDAGVVITSSSVSPDAKTLTVNFTGLDAGKKAIFNIDLDTSDPNAFMFPDYRAVLLGAPVNPGDPTTTPGTAGVTFTNGTPAPNSKTLSLELVKANGDLFYDEAPEFIGQHIRPYQEEDKMEVIKTEVPEPTGIVLALAGFGAFAARRRGAKIA
jgi:hypothetical protein